MQSVVSTTNTFHDVFHEGEHAVQQRSGSVTQGRNSGRMIADTIIPGAIKFVKKQPFVVMGGVDASHRGGSPGFIQIVTSTRLRIPDYAGNGMFNTLGNFAVNPRAGLVIPDFERGRTLQLTGRAEILWDAEDHDSETGGTRRYWDFGIERWIQMEDGLPGSFEFLDYSPHNPGNPS